MNPKPKVTINGRRLELTDAIKNRVNEMVDKLYDHDDKIESIRVELELERHASTHHDEFSAKADLDERRDHLHASAKGDDLYAVIADLEQKMDRLIRRKSKKRVTERRNLKPIEFDVDLPKAVNE